MSLDWNVAKIANRDTVCWRPATDAEVARGDAEPGEKYLQVVTETIIMTLSVAGGCGRLTEKNIVKVCARYAIYQRMFGELMTTRRNDKRVPLAITAAMLQEHVGLTTNWRFTDESDARWSARLMNNAVREQMARADSDARVTIAVEAATGDVALIGAGD